MTKDCLLSRMSDEDLRNYFPLPRVLTGVFKLCQKLFGVIFEEIKSPEAKASAWNKDVSLFRVVDETNGKVLGNFFFDPFIRDDKGYAGGSKGWFIPLRPRSNISGSVPLGALIMSLPPPNYGKPSLLNFAETEEVLRNFGNLLMHILAESQWSDLCGKNGIEWDALDLAGNFMTQW
jgi:oligopeptidase A